MTTLLIRSTANGYIVEPFEMSSNCATCDSDLHVFTNPRDLAQHIQGVAENHERTRNAAQDLRSALDA